MGAGPKLLTLKELRDQGFDWRRPPLSLICLDPSGQGTDYTALVVLERLEFERGEPTDWDYETEHVYRVRVARRIPRSAEFGDVMGVLVAYHRQALKYQRLGRLADHRIVIETNGVGWPFLSNMRGLITEQYRLIGIQTVSKNDDRPYGERGLVMPRAAGLDNMRMLLSLDRVKLRDDTEGRDLMIDELQKIVMNGNKPQAATGSNDDLTMAFTIGLWAGTKIVPPLYRAEKIDHVPTASMYIDLPRGQLN